MHWFLFWMKKRGGGRGGGVWIDWISYVYEEWRGMEREGSITKDVKGSNV
jgi:hypothetical protein